MKKPELSYFCGRALWSQRASGRKLKDLAIIYSNDSLVIRITETKTNCHIYINKVTNGVEMKPLGRMLGHNWLDYEKDLENG
jgi:hypothetical protein